jgi:hypothetical protein
MKNPQNYTNEQPVISFTRVIEVAPHLRSFEGWGPSRWS